MLPKKIDILLIRSFLGPFVVSFFVMLFVLVMQFFWVYMDELIGKGFGIGLILQLLFYMSATLVPLAIPLAVLLASIMTFGALGENYELIAIKSAGVSLLRIMKPLFLLMVAISGFAFFFSNNIIPIANLKALTLLYDLRNSKVTLSLREGQFNKDISGFAIRIGSKSKNGDTIRDVIIYDVSAGAGNDKMVIAKSAELLPVPEKRALIFRLKDGWRYEEAQNGRGANSYSQTRMSFKQYDKVFDMSGFTVRKSDENSMKNGQTMMNISQLTHQIDTIGRNKLREVNRYSSEMKTYYSFQGDQKKTLMNKVAVAAVAKSLPDSGLLAQIPDSVRKRAIELAQAQARSVKLYSEITSKMFDVFNDSIVAYKIEIHRKFSISFACMLLFLIGAPLGAIIRKGGIGLPLIVAVIFFVAYFITSQTGETLSESKKLPPYMGMWLSTVALLPFAVIFIRAAMNDSKMFSKEWYMRVVGMVRSVFRAKKNKAS
ncbi:LptF/LptG family permease [Rurimicrobium arvi]|uniref:LptF/LptG family permease n=1 Tax=Rurimicrobium arvi TaxID=2049916 RepID=A0ABP8N3B8_9BACT